MGRIYQCVNCEHIGSPVNMRCVKCGSEQLTPKLYIGPPRAVAGQQSVVGEIVNYGETRLLSREEIMDLFISGASYDR